jgi:hypothetical protein
MNDTQHTIERIRSANPVPSPDSFPTRALSSAGLLARIDERNTTMTDTLTPIRGTDPGKPPRRNRGPLIGLAVAAAVLLLVGITTFAIGGGEDSPVVTDPPATTTEAPTTTTTTVPPTTTAQFESPLPADTPPLEAAAAIQAAWDAGDMAAADALIRPDSGFLEQNISPGFAAELWYRNATGAVITNRDCRVETPAELANEGFEGTFVTCTENLESGINPGTVIGGGKLAMTVQDGWVVDVFLLGYLGALDGERGGYQAYQNAYLAWMQERFPDNSEVLFDGIDMVIDTPEAAALHQELIPFFLADTNVNRDPQALPADTPLLETVRIFQERFDAGDIAGYEAIFHPLTGYQSGRDARSSWFNAVVGSTTERDCSLVEPTMVRCIEVQSPGLVPGTTLEPFTSEWNGAAGYIWTIEFPEGPPPGFDTLTLPGLTEYRTWVKENVPEAFDTLFPDGLQMRLSTQELRDAHTEMVARYLTAISER